MSIIQEPTHGHDAGIVILNHSGAGKLKKIMPAIARSQIGTA
ncbi:MAG: hypothetical protein NW220_10570 [Leptolyngbyaceae cyanobacterium bins.349]|nr:hypothetical protein [Leptolyngbyaceae cyanobacterium bins.349]